MKRTHTNAGKPITRFMPKGHLMGFGKWKNRTVKWVADNDPSYIAWLMAKGSQHRWGGYAKRKVEEWRKSRSSNTYRGTDSEAMAAFEYEDAVWDEHWGWGAM